MVISFPLVSELSINRRAEAHAISIFTCKMGFVAHKFVAEKDALPRRNAPGASLIFGERSSHNDFEAPREKYPTSSGRRVKRIPNLVKLGKRLPSADNVVCVDNQMQKR